MPSDAFFHQVTVVPWRPGREGAEVLLVSAWSGTPDGRLRWVLPQCGIEPSQTPLDAAAAEAWQEAGVEGRIERLPFARYEYAAGPGLCRVAVFRMRVLRQAERWPNWSERERLWLPRDEAAEMVCGEPLRGVLTRFLTPEMAI